MNKLCNWKNLEFQVNSEVQGRALQNTGAQVEFLTLFCLKISASRSLSMVIKIVFFYHMDVTTRMRVSWEVPRSICPKSRHCFAYDLMILYNQTTVVFLWKYFERQQATMAYFTKIECNVHIEERLVVMRELQPLEIYWKSHLSEHFNSYCWHIHLSERENRDIANLCLILVNENKYQEWWETAIMAMLWIKYVYPYTQ